MSAQDTQCGSIGNSNSESSVKARRNRNFYLDVNNPATCSGNITSWRVCYYGPDEVDEDGEYLATYAIYRRMGAADSYERVSETFRAVLRFTNLAAVDGVVQEGGFWCYNDPIDIGDSPLTIQIGDVLGACVFNPQGGNTFQLDVVGDTGQQSSESLLAMNTGGCARNTPLPSSVLTNSLSNRNSRRLHIHANIGRCCL